MAQHSVRFEDRAESVDVRAGTLLVEAARLAGIEIRQPCGGQGRCGRCAVRVVGGRVRRRSVIRLSEEDVAAGFALACQAVVEEDVSVMVPPADQIERRLSTDHVAPEVTVPEGYQREQSQTVERALLRLAPPSMDDQTDDWARLRTALRIQNGIDHLGVSLQQIRELGGILRTSDWHVGLIYDTAGEPAGSARLIRMGPASAVAADPLAGLAIDIGTTTVTVLLADLDSGEVLSRAAAYNEQITRGEDVISRIIYASRGDGGDELKGLVTETVNRLIASICEKAGIGSDAVVKATVGGNSTMMHLLMGVPPESIRLEPFVTSINAPPLLTARDVGFAMCPDGTIDLLPGVASYMGADITAGVLASGLRSSAETTLFIDIGTNGEMVLGSSQWLVSCACSAGPAFEGSGVVHGMRADRGAIEEVWIDGRSFEPTLRVIGDGRPRGICGSGLISLVAEMFITGIVDKGGHIDETLDTPRIRRGDHGIEYVVARRDEAADGNDISITAVDIDNLLRAKAAVYAGFNVLADRVGVDLASVDRVLIGGAFGKYINVEKAVDIGLLPDLAWDRFDFLGNTSVKGAYLSLLDRAVREEVGEIASSMTYIELSADNSFYEAFTSAMFLPHTDLSRFPSVEASVT